MFWLFFPFILVLDFCFACNFVSVPRVCVVSVQFLSVSSSVFGGFFVVVVLVRVFILVVIIVLLFDLAPACALPLALALDLALPCVGHDILPAL